MAVATEEAHEEGKTEGLEEGLVKGIAKGKAEGIEEGKTEGKIEMARGLILEKIPLSVISSVSGLSEEFLATLT